MSLPRNPPWAVRLYLLCIQRSVWRAAHQNLWDSGWAGFYWRRREDQEAARRIARGFMGMRRRNRERASP